MVRVNLETRLCTSNGYELPIEMHANTRDAFLTGAWDTTGMLLDRYDEVRRVAARLPYITGFTASPPPA